MNISGILDKRFAERLLEVLSAFDSLGVGNATPMLKVKWYIFNALSEQSNIAVKPMSKA